MSIMEIVADAKGKGPEAVEAGLAALRQMADQYAAKTNAALEAYFQGEANQEAAIRNRLMALEKELRAVTQKIDAISPALMQATVAGDNITLSKLQAQLSDLENQRTTISTQVKLVNAAPFPYDKQAYEAVGAAYMAEVTVLSKINYGLDSLHSYAKEMEKKWAAVAGELSRNIRTSNERRIKKVDQEVAGAETVHEHLCRREKETKEEMARAEAVARRTAWLAEKEREEAERKQRELANRPEYRNVQTPGRVIRQKLNHETGEYEDIGSQSNAV